MRTNWDRVKKLFGDRAFNHLVPKEVAVIGLGSVGSYCAEFLAMCGIGNFILIDPDKLEGHNIVRHAANARYVGEPKVKAVKDLIRRRNSHVNVKAYITDVRKNFDLLREADLVLVCVDNEPVKQQINMALLKMRKVALYAGVYERGAGGDVCIVYPNQGPCYACLAAEIRGAVVQDKPRDFDYGMITEDGTLQGEPGLGIHVVRVTLLQAEWALRELLYETGSPLKRPRDNVAIIANDALDVGTTYEGKPIILQLGQTAWFSFPRYPNCRICNPQKVEERVRITDLL